MNPGELALPLPGRLRNALQIRDWAVEALDDDLEPQPGQQPPEAAVPGDSERVLVQAAFAENAGYGETPPAPLSAGACAEAEA